MNARSHESSLTVHQAEPDDVNKDLVRINFVDRGKLPAGHIYRVTVGRNRTYLILRGLQQANRQIRLDEETRDRLAVKVGAAYCFRIAKATLWGQLRWAWNASDPSYRVAAKLGVLSFVLGLLGVFPVIRDVAHWLISN